MRRDRTMDLAAMNCYSLWNGVHQARLIARVGAPQKLTNSKEFFLDPFIAAVPERRVRAENIGWV